MKAARLPVDRRLVVSAFEPETAQADDAALLAVDPRPTAICAWTIKAALGVLHGPARARRRDPRRRCR